MRMIYGKEYIMPYCPKCNTNFVDGIDNCPKCKEPLAESREEEITYVPLVKEEQDAAIRITEYLHYSGVDADYTTSDDNLYTITVLKGEEEAARKLLRIYYENEEHVTDVAENEENIPDVVEDEEENLLYTHNKSYMKASEKYEETHSSAYSFLLVGGIVLFLDILSITGIFVIPFLSNNLLANIVIGVLGIIFLSISISSFCSLKKLKQKAEEEETFTNEVIKQFLDHYTVEAINNDLIGRDEMSDEVATLRRYTIIKDKLIMMYPDLDELYVEYLSEVLFSKLFEE